MSDERSMDVLNGVAGRCGGMLALAMAVACGGRAESAAPAPALDGDFVSVRKALSSAESSLPIAGMPSADEDFYIAIKKSLLGSRWFLSAFMKQFHPDNLPLLQSLGIYDTDKLLAASPLGTRVVSFQIQNDRLFMFDASDRYHETALQDPTLLIEAYPLVESPEFEALVGSEDYVLFDPSQGLNAFRLTSARFADPYLDGAWTFRVGLTFARNFRTLADGAAFEEVFSGELDLGDVLPAWGTLGIALRRYRESELFSSTPAQPYFISNDRYATDGTGQLLSESIHWSFHPGMDPIDIYISAGADRAQAAYPDVDVLGAITLGIESWNEVFGFPVFRAVFTHDDVLRDDGSSFLVVDYPGANGTAWGPVQVNPNNGEILSANVYLSRGAFSLLDELGLGPSQPSAPAARAASVPGRLAATEALAEGTTPARLALSWSTMSPSPAACDHGARAGRSTSGLLAAETEPAAALPSLDDTPPAEIGKAWIQDFVVHEIGHTLGLVHNFKGSLLAPGGSSVMDYQTARDTVALAVPGTYDVAAIRYLHHLSDELPSEPFCSEGDIALDPTCVQFDEGAEPLTEFWAPIYESQLDTALDLGGGVEQLASLNDVLAFARDADPGFVSPERRVQALKLAFGRSAVPLSEQDAAVPEVVAQANGVADAVLRRALLDAPEARGAITFDITDAGVLAVLVEQAGSLLRNADGVRSYAVRRTAADALAALQSDEALVELRNSRDAIAAASDGPLSDTDRPLTADLLARIDAALDPYFR